MNPPPARPNSRLSAQPPPPPRAPTLPPLSPICPLNSSLLQPLSFHYSLSIWHRGQGRCSPRSRNWFLIGSVLSTARTSDAKDPPLSRRPKEFSGTRGVSVFLPPRRATEPVIHYSRFWKSIKGCFFFFFFPPKAVLTHETLISQVNFQNWLLTNCHFAWGSEVRTFLLRVKSQFLY